MSFIERLQTGKLWKIFMAADVDNSNYIKYLLPVWRTLKTVRLSTGRLQNTENLKYACQILSLWPSLIKQ